MVLEGGGGLNQRLCQKTLMGSKLVNPELQFLVVEKTDSLAVESIQGA